MAAEDLCSRDQVRDFLQKPTGDTNQDAIIDSLITRASHSIMRHTQREFAPAASATRTFYYRGGQYLSLTPYDLRTLSAVTIDSDTTPLTLATTDYVLGPTPASDGTYDSIMLINHSVTAKTGWSARQVQITGAWGFATIPPDVEHACVVTVAIWLRRDVSAFSTTFNIEEERVERPEALPSAVRGLLSYWRRIPVGSV